MYEYDPETRLLKRSYWAETGLHQERYAKMQKLVLASGESDNRWVELLRCMGNVYYDCYNNGGCNLEVKSDELDTILNSIEVRDRVTVDQWQAFKDTIVAHRDQLVEPEGYDDYYTCDDCGGSGYEECCDGDEDCPDCYGDGETECCSCDGDGELSEWIEESAAYLRDTCGQDRWMGPLEAVTDAVMEVCAAKLL